MANGYCPDCGTDPSDLMYDPISGYTECLACGLIFKAEPEGKAASSDRGRGKPARPKNRTR
jgi:hypothetical protein